MSSKAIREYDAKLLLAYWLERAPSVAPHATVKTKFQYPAARVAQVSWDPETNTITPDNKIPNWVFTTKLVAKPDQLIKRRGKAGLLALNKSWPEARQWISERAGKPQKVEAVSGTLNNFIVEPFLPHPSKTEYYVCVSSQREGDRILFTHEGGVDVGDVDAKALVLDIPVNKPFPTRQVIAATLLSHVPAEKKDTLTDFLIRLYSVYVDLHFAYLEINPLVVLDAVDGGEPTIHYLDMAAKLDLLNSKRQCTLIKSLLDDATTEKEIMFEAFNEELDNMYNDVSLPNDEAWKAVAKDLQKTKESRNSLDRENSQLKCQIIELQSQQEEWASLLRAHGLIS